MKNTTLAFDEFLIERARKIADSLGMSLNAWINRLVKTEIEGSQKNKITQLMNLAEEIQGSSKGKSWSREDIYER